MSATTTTAAPETPPRAAPGGWLRRRRVGVFAVLALALAAALVVWTGGQEETNDVALDPANAGPDGTRAVARVLDDEGVEVDVARTADDLDRLLADAGDDTGVVVTSADQLGPSTSDRLLAALDGRDLTVVQAGPTTVAALGGAGQPVSVDPGEGVRAGCQDGADPGLADLVGDLEVTVDDAEAYDGAAGCVVVDGSPAVVRADALTLVGVGEALTNDQVLRGDNAALALRLLGEHERLVWYVPTFEDLVPGEDAASLSSLAPDAFGPAVLLLGLVGVGLVLWRARRLGPLAVEPLPVTVRASETTHSRGRMYRRANDREHAARALRAASRRRARRRLRLAAATPDAEVAAAVARHTGLPAERVAALLLDGAVPARDAALVSLAADLADLDRQIIEPSPER